jgi:hypothetical protein
MVLLICRQAHLQLAKHIIRYSVLNVEEASVWTVEYLGIGIEHARITKTFPQSFGMLKTAIFINLLRMKTGSGVRSADV